MDALITKRREMFRLTLVQQCLHKQAPSYLSECFEANGNYGDRITRGHRNLHLKPINLPEKLHASKGHAIGAGIK